MKCQISESFSRVLETTKFDEAARILSSRISLIHTSLLALCLVIKLSINGHIAPELSELQQWFQFPDINVTNVLQSL